MDLEFYKKMYPEYFLLKNDEYIQQFYNNFGEKERHISNQEILDKRIKEGETKPGKKNRFYKKLLPINFHSEKPSMGPPAPRGRFYTQNINRFSNEVPSILDLRHYENFSDYYNILRKSKKRKHNPIRYFDKCNKKGYYFKKFWDHNFLPDIVEIQCSKKIRQGPMRNHYLRPVPNNYKNRPIKKDEEIIVKNNNQYTLRVGVFKKEEGYKQGHLETNEKLLGFITMIRDGDYLQYSWIIGHGDYLNDGIMIFLHLNILEKIIFNKECSYGKGIKYIFYAGHYSGNDTLIKWKEKLFFSPTMLINNK